MAMRSRCIRIPDTLDKKLIETANEMDVNVSEIVKESLFRFFQTEHEISVIESVVGESIQTSDAKIEQLINAKLKETEDRIIARIMKRLDELTANV